MATPLTNNLHPNWKAVLKIFASVGDSCQLVLPKHQCRLIFNLRSTWKADSRATHSRCRWRDRYKPTLRRQMDVNQIYVLFMHTLRLTFRMRFPRHSTTPGNVWVAIPQTIHQSSAILLISLRPQFDREAWRCLYRPSKFPVLPVGAVPASLRLWRWVHFERRENKCYI
jgi:hypothetical protein